MINQRIKAWQNLVCFREQGLSGRMGAYLSEPVLEKHSEDGDAEFLSFGGSSMQGWRVSQEVKIIRSLSMLTICIFLRTLIMRY